MLTPRTISVAIPLLDDRSGIGPCLESVQVQVLPDGAAITEIYVVDGLSTDGSRELVEQMAAADPRIVLLDNPERYVPAAMNRAIVASTGEVIVRVDSHTVLAPDYVAEALAALDASGADVVGGPMRPTGETTFGAAVEFILTSQWGIGGSEFHLEGAEGETDSAYMGVFPRATFVRHGLYHLAFKRNQDDELTYRIREGGGRVWLAPRMRSRYTPRGDVRSLARQFRGYGRYKPLVLVAHPSGLRLRHLAPPAVAVAWLALPLAIWWRIFAALPALHLLALGVAAVTGRPGRFVGRWAALLTVHLSYGAGFLQGALRVLTGERPGPPPDGSAAAAAPPAAPTASDG